MGCASLTSLTIPASTTNIQDRTFNGCSRLMQFSVAADNPAYKSVSGLLLTNDGKTLVAGINGNVTIPDSVINTTAFAFLQYTNLSSLTVPDSVIDIKEYMCYGCNNLTSIVLGNSVASIERYAFRNCSNLTSIVIPNSTIDIGDHAFSYCSNLANVTIPDSTASIVNYAF